VRARGEGKRAFGVDCLRPRRRAFGDGHRESATGSPKTVKSSCMRAFVCACVPLSLSMSLSPPFSHSHSLHSSRSQIFGWFLRIPPPLSLTKMPLPSQGHQAHIKLQYLTEVLGTCSTRDPAEVSCALICRSICFSSIFFILSLIMHTLLFFLLIVPRICSRDGHYLTAGPITKLIVCGEGFR
jgi:hypothetical protein